VAIVHRDRYHLAVELRLVDVAVRVLEGGCDSLVEVGLHLLVVGT